MFAEGSYIDDAGQVLDSNGEATGFSVDDYGMLYSTGGEDTGGAYIDATGELYYGDGSPAGVAVSLDKWSGAGSGNLRTTALHEQYLGEDQSAANFGGRTLRGTLDPDSTDWRTIYDRDDTDSVRESSVEGGLLVDDQGTPLNGSYGYVLAPDGSFFTFSPNEMWVQWGDDWFNLATLATSELRVELIRVAVAQGVPIQGVHHSTAVAGGPVAGAGTLKVQNGMITELTDESGHYKPEAEFLIQTVEYLQGQGMSASQISLIDLEQRAIAESSQGEWDKNKAPVQLDPDGGYTEDDDDGGYTTSS